MFSFHLDESDGGKSSSADRSGSSPHAWGGSCECKSFNGLVATTKKAHLGEVETAATNTLSGSLRSPSSNR